jgi:alanine racemase
MRHAANSAATFFLPDSHFDMIRPGISLYGIDPTGSPWLDRKLRPVAKWTAPLVGVRDIPKGQGVGYSHTWLAPRDSRIGLVPIGYADGYARLLSNRAAMIVQGKNAPVVGRVSMDMTTIDLTDIPQANLGDEVTVIDNDPLSPASAYELAKQAETIPYEILCRIGPRVRRVGVEPTDTADDPPVLPPYMRRK